MAADQHRHVQRPGGGGGAGAGGGVRHGGHQISRGHCGILVLSSGMGSGRKNFCENNKQVKNTI